MINKTEPNIEHDPTPLKSATPPRTRVVRRKGRRGQSIVEVALVLPLLLILFSVIVEAGLAFNSWMRVNTAARDGTRFVLDAGRPTQASDLVRYKLRGLVEAEMTIFVITGTTNASGVIPAGTAYWNYNRTFGSNLTEPRVTRATIQTRLVSSSDPTANQNLGFAIVEVNYSYTPILTTLIAQNATLPMTSYAIVQIHR